MVKSSHMGINGYSKSVELGAQHVQPHQKPKWPHMQERDMPGAFNCTSLQKLRCKKKTVSGSSERLHVRRVGIGEGHQHGRSSGISKKADKRKANCSTLLPRITRLKMSIPTSSQSTLAHNGVASYGPMAPCRSHHRNHTRQNWIF